MAAESLELLNRQTARFADSLRGTLNDHKINWVSGDSFEGKPSGHSIVKPAGGGRSKFKVGAGAAARNRRRAFGSSCCQQCFAGCMQGFPCCFGQIGLRADQVADHLPGSQIERAFGGGPHGERYRALRAETDSPRRRLLARPNSRGLRKQEHGDRLLARFEFSITAKAKWIVQRSRPRPAFGLRNKNTFSNLTL